MGKRTETEQEIHARLRVLAAEIRRLRQDLDQTARLCELRELATDRPRPLKRKAPRKR